MGGVGEAPHRRQVSFEEARQAARAAPARPAPSHRFGAAAATATATGGAWGLDPAGGGGAVGARRRTVRVTRMRRRMSGMRNSGTSWPSCPAP